MYVCMYVYMNICMYVCTYICMYVRMNTFNGLFHSFKLLFSLLLCEQFYPWSYQNSYFVLSSKDSLAFGGGGNFAIYLVHTYIHTHIHTHTNFNTHIYIHSYIYSTYILHIYTVIIILEILLPYMHTVHTYSTYIHIYIHTLTNLEAHAYTQTYTGLDGLGFLHSLLWVTAPLLCCSQDSDLNNGSSGACQTFASPCLASAEVGYLLCMYVCMILSLCMYVCMFVCMYVFKASLCKIHCLYLLCFYVCMYVCSFAKYIACIYHVHMYVCMGQGAYTYIDILSCVGQEFICYSCELFSLHAPTSNSCSQSVKFRVQVCIYVCMYVCVHTYILCISHIDGTQMDGMAILYPYFLIFYFSLNTYFLW